jgi:hypothetical protein
VELVCSDIEVKLMRRVPVISHVFLDPSRVTADDRERVAHNVQRTLDDVHRLNGADGVDQLRLPRSRSARRLRSTAMPAERARRAATSRADVGAPLSAPSAPSRQ